MRRKTRILALCATMGTMAFAAVPATSQAAPGDFSDVCSALGIPANSYPINLGALGFVNIKTCSAAILTNDPCPGPQIPLDYLVPGVLSVKGTVCIGS